MTSWIQKFARYHTQFGWRGVLLGLRTRFARRPFVARIRPRGFNHPIYLRFKTTDTPTLWKIFNEEEYGFPLAKPPTFIIDAGANIGLASLYFAKRFPSAKIVALEPEAENFELLKRNTVNYENIVPLHAALWKENTRLALVDPGLGPWAFQMSDMRVPPSGRVIAEVPAFTVDELMRTHSSTEIGLLKMDIEGGEKPVFDSPSKWISAVQAIMVELHDHITPGSSQAFEAATVEFPIRLFRGETNFVARKASES